VNRNPEVDRWFDEQDHPLDAAMRRAARSSSAPTSA